MVSPALPTRQASTDFLRLVREPATEAGRLQRGTELAVSLVADCDHASVTVLTPYFTETVAASDDVGRRGDGWQHELSEGPGLDSVRYRATVVSQDLGADVRWRSWGPRAVAGLGVRSALSVPLGTQGGTVRSLNLYAERAQAWDAERQALPLALAAALSLAVVEARALDERARSVLARTGLGQAQGIVMERFGLSAAQALDHLHRLSADTRISLVRLAEHIVETRDVPPGGGRRSA